ncbi:hypothetical protein [Palleronia aestuarii]|uniref:hypothetical protein n=1 Tax=Palleronia aestuarii TaxID=568105 RepID=UPI0011B6BD07|nr:hypothetical protein [Palleronia aestuarii]
METGFVGSVVLPALALTTLVLLVAWSAVPRGTRSQARLALGVVLAAGAGLLAGAVLFGALYAGRVPDAAGWLAAAPFRVSFYFLGRSAMAALLWAPILALWWLVAAQAVERRRGEDRMRAGRGVRSRPPPPPDGSR